MCREGLDDHSNVERENEECQCRFAKKKNKVAEDRFPLLFSDDGDEDSLPVVVVLYVEELHSLVEKVQKELTEFSVKCPWAEAELAALWVHAVERLEECTRKLEKVREEPGYDEGTDAEEIEAVTQATDKENKYLERMFDAETRRKFRDRLEASKRICVFYLREHR